MKIQKSNALLLFRQFVFHPLTIGAILPSSGYLADYMAQQISLSDIGQVIELGAGTGVITTAILKRGVPFNRFRVVEKFPPFIQHLRKTFPSLHVIEGDAVHLSQLLNQAHISHVDTIISSLPLRLLSDAMVKDIFKQVSLTLKKGGYFIQFTYDLRQQALLKAARRNHLKLQSSKIIWRNFPPACVHIFVNEKG